MNPLFLLLGFFGASAAVQFGKTENESTSSSGKGAGIQPRSPGDDDGVVKVKGPKDKEDNNDGGIATAPPVTGTDTGEEPAGGTDTNEQPTGNEPTAPTQTGDGSGGAETTPTIIDGTLSVMTGRVATLSPADNNIASIEILSGVDHGTVTVNPDNTFALVMTQTEFTGSQNFTYRATHDDGSVTNHQVNLNVRAGLQEQGWGTGEMHYMLETDDDDKVVVEHGDEHTKVYVSGDSSAYSLADIARAEGMSVSEVTGAWLDAHGGYGQSESMALSEDAGMALWNHITPRDSHTSNWLLLERGHEYSDLGRILNRDTHGESETQPLFVGAWGSGDAPEVTTEFWQAQESSSNVVVQDIHFSGGIFILNAQNMIFDNIQASADEAAIQWSDAITVRNAEFTDIHRDVSQNGGAFEAHSDRIQALYMNHVDGALIENNFFDLNGWDPDGQDPTMFSHNMYFGATMDDVTVRDNIFMRGASYGAQVRSGGFIEDNVFLDNNVAFTALGGDYEGGGPVGNYTLMTDNLVTSGAHKTADLIGGLAMGILETGELTAMVDNIVAHLADPNNDAELNYKIWTHDSHSTESTVYDDTIVYNWQGAREVYSDSVTTEMNTEGLDTTVLDQTTIQIFTAQLLGQPNATIADLADYLRAQGNGAFDEVVDADLIISFFQDGFGVSVDERDLGQTLRFVPNELADGVRWDNRLNWDTEDLPGLYANDSVDLGGNSVTFGTNAEINTLDFGPDGTLTAYSGKLTLNGGITGDEGGTLNTLNAGQIWTDGSDALGLDIIVDGGRFANTGDMVGANLVANEGQTILATGGATYEVSANDTLTVGGGAEVGFDGDGGMAILDMQEGATLAFAAQDGALGTIEEFRSGAFGDEPEVQSGINLGDATLSIDLGGLSASDGNLFTLMDADEIVGLFNDASIGGLGARNATILIDYETDSVMLQLMAGSGTISIETQGVESDVTNGDEALWAALTSNQGLVTEAAQIDTEDDPLDDMAA